MKTRTWLIVAGVAIGGYLIYRWWKNKQAAQQTPQSSNLSSLAPNLVGGSTGPSAGPGVNIPVTITLTSSYPQPQADGEPYTTAQTSGGPIPIDQGPGAPKSFGPLTRTQPQSPGVMRTV